MTIRTRTELEAIFATLGVSHITPANMRDFLESLELYDERQFDYRSTDIESNNTTFIDSGLQFVLRKRNGVKQIHHCRFEMREFLDSTAVGLKHQWLNVNGATFNLFYCRWNFMDDAFNPIDALITTDPTEIHHAPAGTLGPREYPMNIDIAIDPNVYNDGDMIKLQFAQDTTGDAAGAHVMPGSMMVVHSYAVPA